MELYKKLKYIRKIRGITQQETADHFHISRQAIQKWEKGDSAPDISKLRELSIFYNISLDDLFDEYLSEALFKNKVINSQHSFNKSSEELIDTITTPNALDWILIGFIIFSTTLMIVLLNLIGIIITIIILSSMIGVTFSSVYFLINLYINLNNGLGPFMFNLGVSLLSVGVAIILYTNIKKIISKYILYTKRVTQRVQRHISVLRRLQYEYKK